MLSYFYFSGRVPLFRHFFGDITASLPVLMS